jgi:protein-tyrosine phosphatase
MSAARKRLLFVCLGNICRSPTAEAVMRHLVAEAKLADRIEVDSAGTGSWHLDYPPDPRSQAVGRARGIPLSGKSRLVKAEDFVRFDYLLALDRNNFADLQRMAPDAASKSRIHLLRAFEPGDGKGGDVPDPYYGDQDGFEQVFDICLAACRGLLEQVKRDLGA